MSKVSELRRRRGAAQVHPDEDGQQLEQPLLAAEEAAGPALRRSAAEQRELPWPLSAVVHALSAAWRFILGEYGWVGGSIQGCTACCALELRHSARQRAPPALAVLPAVSLAGRHFTHGYRRSPPQACCAACFWRTAGLHRCPRCSKSGWRAYASGQQRLLMARWQSTRWGPGHKQAQEAPREQATAL